jgi:pectate lyase
MKKLLFGMAFLFACGNSSSSPLGGDASLGGRAPATGGATNGGNTSGSGGATGSGGSVVPVATGGTGSGVGGWSGTGGGSMPSDAAAGGTGGIGPVGGTVQTGTGGASAVGGTPQVTTGGSGGAATATGGTGVVGGANGKGGSTGSGGSLGGAPGTGGGSTGGNSGSYGGSIGSSAGSPETKPVGYGQNTTGAGSATTTEVNSMAAIQAAIDAYSGSGGLSLRYTGKFNFSAITDPCTQHTLAAQTVEIKKKNDITLVGADGSAANFGIHIAASSSNIIIRNMVFGLLPGGGDSDAISVEGMSGGVPTNIWIDHNELFSSMVECAGAGDTAFDGLIDLKKGADKVTVSYNYVHDHHKVSLNGYSDSDTAVRHITYHHNIFENVGSRTPLQRGGYSHLFNNYFHQVTTSGANIRMSGYSLIEANYFDTVKNPVTSRDSSALGFWELRNNNIAGPADFATFKITWVASEDQPTADATDWKSTATFPEALGYSYTPSPVSCLKDGLPKVAGAGKGLATLKCSP